METELKEKENLAQEPSYAERYPLGPASPEQVQNTELRENGHTTKKPSQSVANDENQGLKVGDKVIYVVKNELSVIEQ